MEWVVLLAFGIFIGGLVVVAFEATSDHSPRNADK